MKLFELRTEDAADAMCEISALFGNIASDKDLVSTIGAKIDMTGITVAEAAAEIIRRLATSVPMLLKTHRADVFGILAAVNRKTVEDIAEQSFDATLEQIDEIITDKRMQRFFGSRLKKVPTP